MTPAQTRDALNEIPIAEQVACVEREIRMRERAYPRWIDAGRMTQKKADEELAAMRAVLETVRAAAPKGLFG